MAFWLLITDVVLGAGIAGAALGRAACRQRPDLPIIYVSGYPEDALELKALDARQWFLPKPVALADLRAVVQTALGPAPALACRGGGPAAMVAMVAGRLPERCWGCRR